MGIHIGALQDDGSIIAIYDKDLTSFTGVGLMFSKPPEEIVKGGKYYGTIKDWFEVGGVWADRYLHGYNGVDDYFYWRWLLLEWDPLGIFPESRDYNSEEKEYE